MWCMVQDTLQIMLTTADVERIAYSTPHKVSKKYERYIIDFGKFQLIAPPSTTRDTLAELAIH